MDKDELLARFNAEFSEEGRYKYLFYKRLVKAILRQVDKNRGRILDVGSGHGELTIRAALEFPRASIIGVDMEKEMIGSAKKKAANIGVDNIEFIHSQIEDLTVEGINTVISSTTFHHIKNKKKALKAILKTLPRNGKLIVGDFFKPSQSYVRDVEKIRARYPNSASEFDESFRQFTGDLEESLKKHDDTYKICATELKDLMKQAGFRKQTIVKLPIADFAVVVGVK